MMSLPSNIAHLLFRALFTQSNQQFAAIYCSGYGNSGFFVRYLQPVFHLKFEEKSSNLNRKFHCTEIHLWPLFVAPMCSMMFPNSFSCLGLVSGNIVEELPVSKAWFLIISSTRNVLNLHPQPQCNIPYTFSNHCPMPSDIQ